MRSWSSFLSPLTSLRLSLTLQMLMNVRKTDVMRQLSATIPPDPSPAVASPGIRGTGFIAHLVSDRRRAEAQGSPSYFSLTFLLAHSEARWASSQ